MGRARGANAKIVGAFETTYGTPPASGFMPLPFVRSTLGPEQGLVEDDLLGNGREKYDPTLDVVVNDGQVVVPVDLRNFGHWLKLLLGAPTTSGTDPYTHTFESGATALPSMSVEGSLTFLSHVSSRPRQADSISTKSGSKVSICCCQRSARSWSKSHSGANEW